MPDLPSWLCGFDSRRPLNVLCPKDQISGMIYDLGFSRCGALIASRPGSCPARAPSTAAPSRSSTGLVGRVRGIVLCTSTKP